MSHNWRHDAARFDDENLVSCAGLVPVMELAEQTGLPDLLERHVVFRSERIRSGAANPTPKLTSIISGMASVLRRHLLALATRTDVPAGIAEQAFVDIDSLLRPVYGHAKQGASFGHTKIANRQVLRKGLSPLVTTISTRAAAPVLTGIRLRAGKTGSGKGAASMLTEAITTAKTAGATTILCRGDSAFGNHKTITAVVKTGAQFSFVLTKTRPVLRAIGAIPEHAWTPARYPGAVLDPDTGELISDAEVADIDYTAFAGTKHEITARLIVRRVRDRNHPDELFPVWRYHPFFTNTTEPVTDADITHRQHAIIETVFADLIDGPWAHLPSGLFAANAAWATLAAITHNLLRAAGTLTDHTHAVARGATLRRHLINVPARITRPQGKQTLHLPTHWPRASRWKALWDSTFTDHRRQVAA
ncbi:hypothetical protein JOF56_009393 [Kibdelosporangium banguiense]|uniref:Transposase DDE domain-containing protein n=1 Tax=Kibdelosporangium banguiense TaxID=1365924 RepID=A0ABS4TXB8_9PSEU|nr:IS1380 family transposase [Kibdelosporangium banguiense]MBP2329008.1 hypothetical protein [Kibdelosporangium banguiense]